MSALLHSIRVFSHRPIKGICLAILACAPLSGEQFEYADGISMLPARQEHEWITRYFSSVDENTPLAEIVDFIVSIKASLIARGHKVASLVGLAFISRDVLAEQGIEMNEDDFNRIAAEFQIREAQIVSDGFSSVSLDFSPYKIMEVKKHRHKHKKKKYAEMSSKMVCGFLKFLGGALCMAIPVPVIQGAGAALAVNGVNDMVNAAREESDEREREEKMHQQRLIEAELSS